MVPEVTDAMYFDLSECHRKEVFSKLENLRRSKLMCDVKLRVGDREILAHKLLLVSSVPYFYSMFTHDLVESRQDSITLKDMDPQSVETIVNFIYTSQLNITQTNVQTLLRVATILQVNLIKMKCCEFLENQLDPSNCLGIFAFAELHGCVQLKDKAKHYSYRHFSKVVKEDEFLSLPFERVKWILDQNELCVQSESEVFMSFFLKQYIVIIFLILESGCSQSRIALWVIIRTSSTYMGQILRVVSHYFKN